LIFLAKDGVSNILSKNSVLALLKNKYVILSTTTKSQSQNFVSYKTIKKIVMVEPENSTDIKK